MSKSKIRYPLIKPFIESKEINNVMSALKSGWISANGAFVPKFEKLFSLFLVKVFKKFNYSTPRILDFATDFVAVPQKTQN